MPANTSDLSVCVFCGSRFGTNTAYKDAATELGTALAENDMRLVYGAGDVGLPVAQGLIPERVFQQRIDRRVTHGDFL